MFRSRTFWLLQMLALAALYLAAAWLAIHGMTAHVLVQMAGIILAAHVLEIPLAFYMLKERQPQVLRTMFATLLFGLVWWIPARRGLFAVK